MIRVFGVVNHVPHQFEMLKLMDGYDVEFTYLYNDRRKWVDYSGFEPPPRPIHQKLKWATGYEPGKYDLAILHVDQQHVNPDIGKGQLYTEMNEVIQDIPKIVVNHGTPMYPEMYDEKFVIHGGTVQTKSGPKNVPGMKQKIGDNFMIVNSYEAVSRWGWGYPLIHGLDPDEWFDLPKEPRVTIQLSPGGLDAYYNRGLLAAIKGRVKERLGLDIMHISVTSRSRDWTDYRKMLGSSLLYINPTKDSPMPRSRTEAMLSGCCILTSKYHNADEFFTQGENGFIIPDNPLSYAETLDSLMNYNYRECIEIGQHARESAKKYFHIERYLKDLYAVIKGVAEGNPPEWDKKKVWDD